METYIVEEPRGNFRKTDLHALLSDRITFWSELRPVESIRFCDPY